MTHNEVVKLAIELFDGKVIRTYETNHSSLKTDKEPFNPMEIDPNPTTKEKSLYKQRF